MNTQHTPGPWVIEGEEITAKVDPENSNTYFAPVCYMDTDWKKEICDANARLIAAAPDLLAALQALIKEPNGVSWRQAHDAIAKATNGVTA